MNVTKLELRAMWLEALVSGKYKQGKVFLHNLTDDTYCCLGVAQEVAKLAGVSFEEHPMRSYLPEEIIQAFGFNENCDHPNRRKDFTTGPALEYCNDCLNWNFEEIADYVETHPERVFVDA